jgi:uncharacterized protein YgiM (DUF1202 family)
VIEYWHLAVLYGTVRAGGAAMRTRHVVVVSLLLLAAVAVFAADAPAERSVIVKETPVRDKPSFTGKILGKLLYTDRVQILEMPAGSSWVKVRFAAKKLEGWVHISSLAKDEKPVVKAGAENVAAGASGSEVALAGKGFNPEVEAEYKKDKTLNYTAVDAMEAYVVQPAALSAFITQGGLNVEGGAR